MHLGWVLVAVLSFALGIAVGTQRAEPPPPAPVVHTIERVPAAEPPPPEDPLQAPLAAGDWAAAIAWVDAAGTPEDRSARQRRLADGAARLAETGQMHEAAELLARYADARADAAPVVFQLVEYYRQLDRSDEAIEPLLALLAYPPSDAAAREGRRQLDEIIYQLHQHILDDSGPEALVTFYESLSAREPSYDGHRAGLVLALLAAGELERAARELRTVGYNGVSIEQLEDLERAVSLASAGGVLERRGGSIFAGVDIDGLPFELIVDTGATRTALAPDVLDRVGAVDLGRRLSVQTANGVVDAPAFEVIDVRVGAVAVDRLTVLQLDGLPHGIDGLLGMDVLTQLDELVLP